MLLLFSRRGCQVAREVWGVRASHLQDYDDYPVESDADTRRRIEGLCIA